MSVITDELDASIQRLRVGIDNAHFLNTSVGGHIYDAREYIGKHRCRRQHCTVQCDCAPEYTAKHERVHGPLVSRKIYTYVTNDTGYYRPFHVRGA